MKYIFYSCIFFVCLRIQAQPALLPSIGLNGIPADTDSVCYIPWYLGSFYSSGIAAGDTAADFTLYSINGDSLNLANWLSTGKPLLLVAGSYTCPVFRNKIASINNIVNLYGAQVNVAVIYTIEAHPDIDTSVYFGYVNTGNQNINAGILYRQPVTYGERKDVVADMLNALNLNAPVFLDGSCNNWWSYYGPAPNNAYLIDTNGIVFSKHGWYDKFPDNIICEIDSLLGNQVSCAPVTGGGTFMFNMISNDTMHADPGFTVTLEGELVNNSASDVQVDVHRVINSLPNGWGSSLCLDVCYSTSTDSVSLIIPSGTTQHFYFYIYTTSVIDTARTRVRFKNHDDPSNIYTRNLFGITSTSTAVSENEYHGFNTNIYPNPSSGNALITVDSQYNATLALKFFDITGRQIKMVELGYLTAGMYTLPLDLSGFNSGIYFLKMESAGEIVSLNKFVIRP